MQCQWSAAGMQVFTTPLVVDLDGDGKPEIVFIALPCVSRRCDRRSVRLVAIRGDDCSEVWSVPTTILFSSQLAAGDLTGDGRPEIVAFQWDKTNTDITAGMSGEAVEVFGPDGKSLAVSAKIPELFSSPGAIPEKVSSGPAIADLDGVMPPEIILGGVVLRFAAGPPAKLTVLFERSAPPGSFGWLSLVADVDLDGKPEVVTGNRIWDGLTGADKTPAGLAILPGGYPAVAQMDKTTPEPEIVLVSSDSERASLLSFVHPKTGKVVFGPYDLQLPGQQTRGGAPTVADFDGDGQPEVGLALETEYRVYDQECAAVPLPAKCQAPGILWSSATQDKTSGSTTSTVFDFNGDCAAEVVYRDECWLRIYDGATGKVRAAYNITSGTLLEGPVIADVDGDGHAEIVVSSDDYDCFGHNKPEEHTMTPWTGPTHGVLVLRDPDDRWLPARRIWNQASYHVTNVNEDGTIPPKETNSWDSFNSYRQNVRP